MPDKDTPPDFEENPNVVSDAIQQRLSFEMGADDEYGSLLAFAVPYGDGAKRDMVMSISDRVLPWEVNMVAADRKYFPGGADGYNAYKTRYGLGQIHYGEDIRASETQEFIAQGSCNNSLCFVGPHRVYSPWSNTFYELWCARPALPFPPCGSLRARLTRPPSLAPFAAPVKDISAPTRCLATLATGAARRSRLRRLGKPWFPLRPRRTRR